MIHITGDTHADFNDILDRIKHSFISDGDTLIVTGDFGFTWGDSLNETYLDYLEHAPFNIAFIDGNHENFDKLYSYPEVDFCGGRAHKVRKNIFHLKKDTHIEVLSHSISDLQSEVLWRFY